jgi:hypothetical protein
MKKPLDNGFFVVFCFDVIYPSSITCNGLWRKKQKKTIGFFVKSIKQGIQTMDKMNEI